VGWLAGWWVVVVGLVVVVVMVMVVVVVVVVVVGKQGHRLHFTSSWIKMPIPVQDGICLFASLVKERYHIHTAIKSHEIA
jgi:hypothetical protein